MNEPSVAAGVEEVSVLEDFVDIFHAPSEVFERRKAAGFWAPLIVIGVVGTVLSFASSRILSSPGFADVRRHERALLEENPGTDLSGAQSAMDSLGTLFALMGGFVMVMGIMILGLVLWVGVKIAGSKMDARRGVVVAAYAGIPSLVAGLVALLEGMARGPSTLDSMSRLSWSPARFLDPDTATEMDFFLAGLLDVFTLWWVFLVVIGLAIVGRISRTRALTVVVGICVLASLPEVIGALLG